MTTVLKKTLTKAHRAEIARDMVIASTKKAGDRISKELAKIQDCTKGCLLGYFYEKVPEIPVSRVAELLQHGVLRSTCLTNICVYPSEGAEVFGELEWRLVDQSPRNLETNLFLWDPMLRSWDGYKTVFTGAYLGRMAPELELLSSFADVPHVSLPNLKPSAAKGGDAKIVNQINSMQGRAMVQLHAMKCLMEEARLMYDNLLLAMQQFKNTEQLAEGIPEAVQHLPAELFEPASTTQVADPKFINDIRAKLAKGLPV